MSQFDWVVEAFKKNSFTVFDTETTGLEPKTCRIVEIGGLRFNARGVIARFNVLINPGSPMPAEVTKINGITDAMLKGQPDSGKVIPDFLRFAGDSVLIAHNAPFDISFVNSELIRIGMKPLANPVIDTRIFAKEMFPNLPKYSLQELALRFGIEARDAHRAEDDARVCMELFLKCLGELQIRSPNTSKADDDLFAQARADAEQPNGALTSRDDSLFDDDDFEEEENFDETPE